MPIPDTHTWYPCLTSDTSIKYLRSLADTGTATSYLYHHFWYRIGFARFESDVARDRAQVWRKRPERESGELLWGPPSLRGPPRSTQPEQNKQTAAEWHSFWEALRTLVKHDVFALATAAISRKQANGCRVVLFFEIARSSRQDRDAIGQDSGKMSADFSRYIVNKPPVFEPFWSTSRHTRQKQSNGLRVVHFS